MGLLAGRTEQRRGSALAQTQTLAAKPGGASFGASGSCGAKLAPQFGAKCIRATGDAGNVITDVGDDWGAGLERKHPIKRRHAVNFGGGNVQSQGDIVESAGADPADAVLHRMQHGQKTMAPAMVVAVES
jgi:hypothetical protein